MLYLAIGGFVFNQTLSRKAASRGMNEMSDADALLGREGLNKKIAQRKPWERFMSRIIGDASGLTAFYDKPYYPLFLEGLKWYFENNPEIVTINSPAGERLHADMFLSEKHSDVWFICLHGYTSAPRDMSGPAKIYRDGWGCNVLLPYLRGHSLSESKYASMGWLDRLDIVSWIEYLCREYHNPKIIIHGISMGGAVAMMTLGENLPVNVVCAIADCGYSSFWEEYVLQAKTAFRLPVFPFMYALNTVIRIRLGFSMKEASCVEQVKKSKTPALFIHGDKDTVVPFWMLDKVYDACASDKEKLVVSGAEHGEAHYDEQLYYRTVKEFIERYAPELKNI